MWMFGFVYTHAHLIQIRFYKFDFFFFFCPRPRNKNRNQSLVCCCQKDHKKLENNGDSCRDRMSGVTVINHSHCMYTHLPVAAAIIHRASRQDDGAGHQQLQQQHQDEVKIDLRTEVNKPG